MNTETELPPENPLTLRDWLWRLLHHQDLIFVRQQNGTVCFRDLSPKDQATYIHNWLLERVTAEMIDSATPRRCLQVDLVGEHAEIFAHLMRAGCFAEYQADLVASQILSRVLESYNEAQKQKAR